MNDEVRDLLPFYALDVLSDEERTLVEAYFAQYPDARAELAEFELATEALSYEAAPLTPRADIRDALLADMQREAVETSKLSVETARTPVRATVTDSSGLVTWFGRLREQWAMPMLAGSVALATFALLWAFTLQGQLRTATAELIEANSAIAAMSDNVEALQGEMETLITTNENLQRQLEEQSTTLAIYRNPALQHVAVAGTEIQAEAAGQFSFDVEAMQAALSVSGLAALDANETYQLWYINADGAFSGGLFTVQADGTANVVFDSAEIVPFDAIGISIEPAGGSESPSDQIVMLGSL